MKQLPTASFSNWRHPEGRRPLIKRGLSCDVYDNSWTC